MSQSFFITETKEARKNIVLIGCVTDNNSSFDELEMIKNEVNQKVDLNCMAEEFDSRLILYVANARVKGFENFLVLSNDFYVLAYLLAYFDKFKKKRTFRK